MKDLVERVIKKLERAERTIQVINCLVELDSFSEHERLAQIKGAVEAYYESIKPPICAACGQPVSPQDEAVNADGKIIHRNC